MSECARNERDGSSDRSFTPAGFPMPNVEGSMSCFQYNGAQNGVAGTSADEHKVGFFLPKIKAEAGVSLRLASRGGGVILWWNDHDGSMPDLSVQEDRGNGRMNPPI